MPDEPTVKGRRRLTRWHQIALLVSSLATGVLGYFVASGWRFQDPNARLLDHEHRLDGVEASVDTLKRLITDDTRRTRSDLQFLIRRECFRMPAEQRGVEEKCDRRPP